MSTFVYLTKYSEVIIYFFGSYLIFIGIFQKLQLKMCGNKHKHKQVPNRKGGKLYFKSRLLNRYILIFTLDETQIPELRTVLPNISNHWLQLKQDIKYLKIRWIIWTVSIYWQLTCPFWILRCASSIWFTSKAK